MGLTKVYKYTSIQHELSFFQNKKVNLEITIEIDKSIQVYSMNSISFKIKIKTKNDNWDKQKYTSIQVYSMNSFSCKIEKQTYK